MRGRFGFAIAVGLGSTLSMSRSGFSSFGINGNALRLPALPSMCCNGGLKYLNGKEVQNFLDICLLLELEFT